MRVCFDAFPQGYGNSRPPDRTFPSAREFFAQDADDAVALMKQLQLEPFSLLGWSDGGITAMFIAGNDLICVILSYMRYYMIYNRGRNHHASYKVGIGIITIHMK